MDKAKKEELPKKKVAKKKAGAVAVKAGAPKKAAPKKAPLKKAAAPKKVVEPKKAVDKPVTAKPVVKKAAKKAPEKTVSRRAIVVEQKVIVKKPPVSIREGSKKYKPEAPTNIKTIKNTDGKVLGHRPTHELNIANPSKNIVQTKKKRKSILGDDTDHGTFMRYNDADLEEFRKTIVEKMEKARTELTYLQGLITRKDDSGTDDTENPYASMEDGSLANQREQLNQMAGRQISFINNLENALIRIKNKTYGICRITGQLIAKSRLLAVPHATLSKEAKDSRR